VLLVYFSKGEEVEWRLGGGHSEDRGSGDSGDKVTPGERHTRLCSAPFLLAIIHISTRLPVPVSIDRIELQS